ncbi:MAG: response regulator [Candidatus Moraniibacteriota bacterium]
MEKAIKVLMVDDDQETRSLYADALRAVNFKVSEGTDGLEGLELANKDVPDLIITGIIMPRMDGFQFLEALKKNVVTAAVPVMILSHLGREEDQKHAAELGVKDFMIRDMTTPNDMIEQINARLVSKDYVLGIDAFSFDAARFAKDFDLNPDFVCPEAKAGGRIVLTLRKSKDGAKRFDAEITCQ